MSSEYILVYLIVNIVCFLTAVTILMRLTHSIGSDTEVRLFRMMLIMYMLFLGCEIVWITGVGKLLPVSPHFGTVVKVAGTAFIPIMVYFWMQYAELRFENSRVHSKKFRALTFIPAGLMLLIYLSTPVTGLIAKVSPEGTLTPGPMIVLTGVIDNLYGIAVVVHALILFFRNKDSMKRRTYVTHIKFIVICTLGGMLDAVVSDTPVLPLAIMLSFNVLFINLQESKIFNDALTGLNNRRLADRYVEEAIDDVTETSPFYLLMMDIDDFKSINDTYGHLEGDKALNLVSGVLDTLIGEYRGFLARWGGDEFMAVMKTSDGSKVEEFKSRLEQMLRKVTKENELAYTLSMSVGQAKCTNKQATTAGIINEADGSLYEAKRQKSIAT